MKLNSYCDKTKKKSNDSKRDITQILTKLKISNWDKTQIVTTQIVTKLKLRQNSNWNKTQNVTKLKL